VFIAFYRGRRSAGEWWPGVVTGDVNGFNTIGGEARLRGVKEGP
jgi:hypothetical protein